MTQQPEETVVRQASRALSNTIAGGIVAAMMIGAAFGGYGAARSAASAHVDAAASLSSPAAPVSRPASTSTAVVTIKSDPHATGVYTFSPGIVTARAGHKLTLIFKNPGMMVHGIAIPQFGVSMTMINPATGGKASTTTVSFVPTKPGTYTVKCTIFCGPGHSQMMFKLVVK